MLKLFDVEYDEKHTGASTFNFEKYYFCYMQDIMDTTNSTVTIKSWVELYSDIMYSWAFHKTSNKEIAEDLVQETFMAAFQSFTIFEGKSNPKTWLFAILNNKINEHYRKHYKNPTRSEQQESEKGEHSLFDTLFDDDGQWKKGQQPSEWQYETENILDDAEFNKVMQHCMGKLPANWFFAIQLKYLEEKKGTLICQELQIAPTNFWQILHRAKLQLRKCLEIHWFKK